MFEWLLHIDRDVFSFINGSLANPVTDLVMPVITNDMVLRVLYVLVLAGLLLFGGRRFIWVILFSIIVVAATDLCASALFKPWIMRPRPCRVMDVHLLVGCGAGYSFPSSHAANLFGQALFFGMLYKKYLPYLAGFSFLVGVSRIFVGVHYPLDVIAGLTLGVLAGAPAARVLWKLHAGDRLKPRQTMQPFMPDRR